MFAAGILQTMFSQLMVCSNFCSLQRVGCSLSGPSLVFCHYCVVAGLVGCVATLSSAFAALAATTAALAAFAADVASQIGFVGLGVRCFAFRDLQSHCRRALAALTVIGFTAFRRLRPQLLASSGILEVSGRYGFSSRLEPGRHGPGSLFAYSRYPSRT